MWRRRKSVWPISRTLVVTLALVFAVVLSNFAARLSHSSNGFVQPTSRRDLAPFLAIGISPLVALPGSADAIRDDIPPSRLALYRGKADTLRVGGEWWRFFIGDAIKRGTGSGSGMKSNADDCGGMCDAANSLSLVRKLIRAPGSALSQVDFALITPMSTMVDLPVWDPDQCDEAKVLVTDVQKSIRELGDCIADENDGDKASKLYLKTLEKMNIFFKYANTASSVTPDDEQFLPLLPLTTEDLKNEPYWLERRLQFNIASDPQAQFKERNALGSKELRNSLKRFPGATLLLR